MPACFRKKIVRYTLYPIVNSKNLFKILWVDNASCEGIAQFLYEAFSELIKVQENGRVSIRSLKLYEDEKNFVTYTPKKIAPLRKEIIRP